MKHTKKRIAVTAASAVMAVIALAVPISTSVLHARGGIPAHRETTTEPSDEEPPIRFDEGVELFVFDYEGFDRHLLVIEDEEARQHERLPSGNMPLTWELSFTPTQDIDVQDISVENLNSNHSQFTEILIELPAREENKNDTLELRSEIERPGTEQKRTLGEAEEKQGETTIGYVQEGGPFLIEIKNPDKNYVGRPLKVKDRRILEGLVMGEFGNDYLGAVLVAQCIRDSMVKSGTNSAAVIKRMYGYTAPVRKYVSQNVKKAVAFVFDEGGSGVQHPIYYFYASNLVRGSWHETQKFVVQRHAVRFFSRRTQ
jgi:hypothetical protein